MKPSFLSLFKRGRFFRLRPSADGSESEEESKARQEMERFAVAALGFCLEHAPSFKEEFVRNVIGWTDPIDVNQGRIQVEPHHWSDLLVRHRCFGAVIEFKLGGALSDHQNPDRPEFMERGYGKEIQGQLFKGFKGPVFYIVIGAKDKFKEKDEPFRCFQKDWSCIEGLAEGHLLEDLYDCLAEFGVAPFDGRKFKQTDNMKLGEHARKSAEMFQLLWDAATQLGFDARRVKPDTSFSEKDESYFGLQLDLRTGPGNSKDSLTELQRLVQPTGAVGWFGYEASEESPSLAVWFYCGNQEAMKAVAEGLIRGGVEKAIIQEDAVEPNSNCLRVGIPAGTHAAGDKEWFLEVFRAVLKR